MRRRKATGGEARKRPVSTTAERREWRKCFGARLFLARCVLCLSAEDAAADFGVSLKRYQGIEAGARFNGVQSYQALVNFSRVRGVSYCWMLENDTWRGVLPADPLPGGKDPYKNYGARLILARIVLGLTQEQMAQTCGVSLRTYLGYERSGPFKSLSPFARLYHSNHVSLDWIFTTVRLAKPRGRK